MGLWVLYFIVKLYLYFRGYITFHALPNLLLFAYFALPYWIQRPLGWPVRLIHAAVGTLFALLSFWLDSYFPPLSMVLGFLAESNARPTASYIAGFLTGYWNPADFCAILMLSGACLWTRWRRFKLAPLVLLVMIVPLVQSSLQGSVPPPQDAQFYKQEEKNPVRFEAAPAGSVPFDIVIIHVCSLSWDDLAQIGFDWKPFFSKFDVLFTNFNTVTSYSIPAILRVLRAPCGQVPHDALYRDAAPECYLLGALQNVGYSPFAAFDHDGKWMDMADTVARFGKAKLSLDPQGLPVDSTDFDGSPLYNNLAVLDALWKIRESSGAPRAVLYYNTASLHDGAHGVHDAIWWKRARPDKYREFVTMLFSDVSTFLDQLQGSGRDVLVVFVPEHGAAIAGSRIQAKSLRDIPLPRITFVPVALKFIRARGATAVVQRQIEKPTSYRALAYFIKQALSLGPAAAITSEKSLAGVPETAYFAENQYAKIWERGGAYLYQGKDHVWSWLPSDVVGQKPTGTGGKAHSS